MKKKRKKQLSKDEKAILRHRSDIYYARKATEDYDCQDCIHLKTHSCGNPTMIGCPDFYDAIKDRNFETIKQV